MTNWTTKIWRGLFALLTAGVLIVTFYFPLIGLGYALDSSADLQSRGIGLLWFLPSVALLVLLVGLLPPARGRVLLWIGVGGTLLLLPSIVAGIWMRYPEIIGSLAGLLYLGVWWFFAHPKLFPGPLHSSK